jgi:hypothetical protein
MRQITLDSQLLAVIAAKAMRRAVAEYYGLVEILGRGARLPFSAIEEVLGRAGRTAEELLRDAFASDSPAPWSGKPCDRCAGRLRVYRSQRIADSIRQYFHCGQCHRRPSHYTRCLPTAAVPKRRRAANTPRKKTRRS